MQNVKFNTGVVLQGYTAAYRATENREFLECARRAADFLLADIGDDGHFRTHEPFVSPDRYKRIIVSVPCLCTFLAKIYETNVIRKLQ